MRVIYFNQNLFILCRSDPAQASSGDRYRKGYSTDDLSVLFVMDALYNSGFHWCVW